MAPSIMWFRRDLRLGDNPALHEAVRLGGVDGVIPLFVLDEALLAPCGPARAAYLAESLRLLDESLGGGLVIRRGPPERALIALAREQGIRDVVIAADFAPGGMARDARIEVELRAAGIELHRRSSPYAVDPGTVRGDSGAPLKVFTAFRRRFDLIEASVVLDVPDIVLAEAASDAGPHDVVASAGTRRPALFGDLSDDPPASLPVAGEAAAAAQLDRFVAGGLAAYSSERNVLGHEGTSRLSAALRFGAIHPRRILLAAGSAGEGATTFRSEIAWREFYADVLFHNPSSVREDLQAKMSGLEVDRGPEAEERFRLWAAGETGIPLVDACMRQLLAEGWMHNRGRMLAASFLVKHLHLDWRWGARWFMWRLADGDLASNVHGWQWTAGTGTDAAPYYRVFSPVAQAERFDPDAAYIHRWLPELSAIDPPAVLQPGGGVDLLHPADYPAPIVDLKAEREEALRRLEELKATW